MFDILVLRAEKALINRLNSAINKSKKCEMRRGHRL